MTNLSRTAFSNIVGFCHPALCSFRILFSRFTSLIFVSFLFFVREGKRKITPHTFPLFLSLSTLPNNPLYTGWVVAVWSVCPAHLSINSLSLSLSLSPPPLNLGEGKIRLKSVFFIFPVYPLFSSSKDPLPFSLILNSRLAVAWQQVGRYFRVLMLSFI